MKFKELIKNSSPYLIAEIGVNHENNLILAEKIIKQAKIGGADAVKFQTYKAETIAAKKSPYYWDLKKVNIKSQYTLFKKYEKFTENDYIKLKKICDHYNIEFLSTPFDTNSALFLNKIVKFFKIASADLTNLMLIDCVCKLKKPILLSTGASNFKEISFVENYIKRNFSKIDIALMHCILSYPTKFKDAHLEMIPFLKRKFNKRIIAFISLPKTSLGIIKLFCVSLKLSLYLILKLSTNNFAALFLPNPEVKNIVVIEEFLIPSRIAFVFRHKLYNSLSFVIFSFSRSHFRIKSVIEVNELLRVSIIFFAEEKSLFGNASDRIDHRVFLFP